ncbi:glycosyltransferase family 4 protein [Bacillus massilinigeriensis]|uniref:glycosyltransferase family 4 protein n=1 Tax=Bacillus massilionigeriensis TaxID=1805475 RepID=UPI00096AE096|nr:glycosyltransferase family 4 protein [Bacillus massilionigeriensis]
MKLLWITNISLPEASILLKEEISPFGGWLIDIAKLLSDNENIHLNIAFPKNDAEGIDFINGEKVNYFTFPSITSKDNQWNNHFSEKIIEQVKPDIVHIFGTELYHSHAIVNICKKRNIKCVISIQGLVSIISKHYTLGLPVDIQRSFTIRDFIKQDNIKQQQRKFEKRGKYEIETLQKASYIIGRTTWDRACLSFINNNVKYYHCYETLRSEFYKNKWDINQCERYSIFISQGTYPIKGLHFMIEALPLILKRFSKARLYIGGPDITRNKSLLEKLKLSSYGKYINTLIQKYNLENHITFTGILSEKQICKRFLLSNAFVCPSTIENSPNSLGEAMILGVPSIASNVGGVSDLLKHKEEGFIYPSDAPYMLAYYTCEVLGNDQLALNLSKNARIKALKLHDKHQNYKRLLEIYDDIFNMV